MITLALLLLLAVIGGIALIIVLGDMAHEYGEQDDPRDDYGRTARLRREPPREQAVEMRNGSTITFTSDPSDPKQYQGVDGEPRP